MSLGAANRSSCSLGAQDARDFSERLKLGLDLNGAEIHDGGVVEKQLQLTAGGNYALRHHNGSFDFGPTRAGSAARDSG